MNKETEVMQRVRLAAGGRPGTRLFRNNVGVARFPDGQPVRYGLCPGSADLIGWRTVGRVAVFVAIEVKRPGEACTPGQAAFLSAVRAAGGIAGVATSPDEALELLDGAL